MAGPRGRPTKKKPRGEKDADFHRRPTGVYFPAVNSFSATVLVASEGYYCFHEKDDFPVSLYTSLPEVWDRAELLQRIEIRLFGKKNREKSLFFKDFQGTQLLKRGGGQVFLGGGSLCCICVSTSKSHFWEGYGWRYCVPRWPGWVHLTGHLPICITPHRQLGGPRGSYTTRCPKLVFRGGATFRGGHFLAFCFINTPSLQKSRTSGKQW